MQDYIFYYITLHESIDWIILNLNNKTIVIVNKKEMNTFNLVPSLVSQ